MANNIFQLSLLRQTMQVRFRPTIKWFNLRLDLSAPLEKKYQEWTINNGDLALYSPDDKKALEVFTNQITYLAEDTKKDYKEGLEQVSQISDEAVKKCNITEIRRIGFRKTVILNSKIKFEEIIDLLNNKLSTQNDQVKKLRGDKIVDSVYVTDTLHGQISNHIQIGAVDRKQGRTIFASKFGQDKLITENNNLFIDIDTSMSEKLNKDKIEENLNSIIKLNHEISDGYLQYISKG